MDINSEVDYDDYMIKELELDKLISELRNIRSELVKISEAIRNTSR